MINLPPISKKNIVHVRGELATKKDAIATLLAYGTDMFGDKTVYTYTGNSGHFLWTDGKDMWQDYNFDPLEF